MQSKVGLVSRTPGRVENLTLFEIYCYVSSIYTEMYGFLIDGQDTYIYYANIPSCGSRESELRFSAEYLHRWLASLCDV